MRYKCEGCDNECRVEMETFLPTWCVTKKATRVNWIPAPEPLVLIAPENEPCIPELFINGYRTGAYGDWGEKAAWQMYLPNAEKRWKYILLLAKHTDENGQVWRLVHNEEGLLKVPEGVV